MKFLFKLIKYVIILLLTSPIWFTALVLIMAYKDYTPQETVYREASEQITFSSKIESAMNQFIVTNENFDLSLTQDEANIAIIELLKESNENYLSTDESIDGNQRTYAISLGSSGGLKGVTVFFDSENIEIEAGFDANFASITYKTTIFLRFKIEVSEGLYSLSLKEVALGNMPFAWMYELGDWISGLFIEGGISGVIENVLPFGSFNGKERSITISNEDIADFISQDDPESKDKINALLSVISSVGLNTKFVDENASIGAILTDANYTKGDYQLAKNLQNDDDVRVMFNTQVSSLLLSSLISDTGKLVFEMSEMSFNQLLDYYLRDQMSIQSNFTINNTTYTITTKPLFANFVNNQIELTLILELTYDKGSEKFITAFNLVTTPEVQGRDLIFNIDSLYIGDSFLHDSLSLDLILGLLGNDNELVSGNSIIIKDFIDEFVEQGLEVESVSVVDNHFISFAVQSTNDTTTQIISQLQQAIADAIDKTFNELLTDPVFDEVTNIANEYLLGNATEEELLEEINKLTEEQQLEVYNGLVDSLDDVDISSIIPNE